MRSSPVSAPGRFNGFEILESHGASVAVGHPRPRFNPGHRRMNAPVLPRCGPSSNPPYDKIKVYTYANGDLVPVKALVV